MAEYELRLHGERDGVAIVSPPRRVELRKPPVWTRLWRRLRGQPAVLTNRETIVFTADELRPFVEGYLKRTSLRPVPLSPSSDSAP